MTIKVAQQGIEYYLFDTESRIVLDKVPPGSYLLSVSPQGFYLEKTAPFSKPNKIYGNANKLVDRVITTYRDRTSNTGLLLHGEKGSGKTLTGQLISLRAQELGIPTILIGSAYTGPAYHQFIRDIPGEAVLFYDEFEKVYDREKQQDLLTLLDGVFPSKKLFVLTSNSSYQIDSFFLNRPGRIYYSIPFKGLDREFIREYSEDNLKNKEHLDGIITVSALFWNFNFDLLKALIEEVNRYDESPVEAVKLLNASIDNSHDGRQQYKVILTIDGKRVRTREKSLYCNPISNRPVNVTMNEGETERLMMELNEDTEDIRPRSTTLRRYSFTSKYLKTPDVANGYFRYEKGPAVLELRLVRDRDYSIYDGYSRMKGRVQY